jgi:hypothetical protein
LTCVGFVNLVWICVPFNWFRVVAVGISAAALITTFASGLGSFFRVNTYSFPVVVTLLALIITSALVITGCRYLLAWLYKKRLLKNKEKNADSTGVKIWNKLAGVVTKKEKKEELAELENAIAQDSSKEIKSKTQEKKRGKNEKK